MLIYPRPITINLTMDITSGLNQKQSAAVQAGTGPSLILAGPGSGKTRVLTYRIAYLISHLGVRPFNILSVTFTNKAAREMEARVALLVGSNTRGMMLGTFHSICARILRREAGELAFESNFVIYDADDQKRIVKNIIREMNLDEKTYRARNIQAKISNAKNELLLPEAFAAISHREEVVKRIYTQYQKTLLECNALDFDDLLLWTVYLLENNAEVRERYARRFEHVLVDEFQDTNMAQYRLVQLLSSHHQNIYVVGDPDQSIYSWRGADYRNVLRFNNDYPKATTIILEQNYRSTQNILNTAMAVIEPNPNRESKALFSKLGNGQKITINESFNGTEEGRYVVQEIAKIIASGNFNPGDFAIMYRTNAQSRVLEEAFIQNNLPYRLVGAQRFYGRREIKDLLCYLRVIHNPVDEISLQRIINTPKRKIGAKTFGKTRTLAQSMSISTSELLLRLCDNSQLDLQSYYSKGALSALQNFGNMLSNWLDAKDKLTPLELIDKILEDINYAAYIEVNTEEGFERWENINEIRRKASDYNEESLTALLEEIALVSDQDTITVGEDVPTMLTLHASKGLEFPVVFIVGLEDGTLPHFRSFNDPEGMAEERRLFYVGITRAEKRLYLSLAHNRMTFGISEPTEPSRFLDDIPEELVMGQSMKPRDHSKRSFSGLYEWDKEEKIVYTPTHHSGQRIKHAMFGEGIVLGVEMDGKDEIVNIFFDNGTSKKLIASFAKLEIIK